MIIHYITHNCRVVHRGTDWSAANVAWNNRKPMLTAGEVMCWRHESMGRDDFAADAPGLVAVPVITDGVRGTLYVRDALNYECVGARRRKMVRA